MPRTLPHLQLNGAFQTGADNWGDALNADLQKLSALVQCNVISTIDTKPSTPSVGVYLLSGAEGTYPNNVAVYENGVWVHFSPQSGWLIYDRLASTFRYFNGTAWIALPLNSNTLIALAALSTSNGVIEQTGATTFVKRAVGTSADTDIISRGAGDARYSSQAHLHPNEVAFGLEAEASSGTVIFRYMFTKAFHFAGDFGGTLARAESANPSYVLTVWLQNNALDPFIQMGTVTVEADGSVTGSTVSGNSFVAQPGSVLKIVAPSSGTVMGLAVTFVSS